MVPQPNAPEPDVAAPPSSKKAEALASHSRLAETRAATSGDDDGEPIPLRLKAGSVIGRFALGDLLGRGGMGEVYAAVDMKSGEEVAIKLLRPELLASPQALARFHREATLTCKLRGPHAVRVIEVGGGATGAPFIAMERLHGYDLADLLDRRRQLEVPEAVGWLIQACEAIAQAHDVGVIHRDIKPANLFVATTPDGPVLKVLDFGISRLRDEDSAKLTATHNTLGTPIYMAPEQAKSSRNADARSDVWSLGVILYELLTNAVPFNGDSPTEIAVNVCTLPPAPLSTWRRDIPPGVEATIMKALSKEPAGRFASPRDLADALRPFAGASMPVVDEGSSPPMELAALRSMPTERLRAKDGGRDSRRRSLRLAACAAALVCAVAAPFLLGSGGVAESATNGRVASEAVDEPAAVAPVEEPPLEDVAAPVAAAPSASAPPVEGAVAPPAQPSASSKKAPAKAPTARSSSPRRPQVSPPSPGRWTRPKFDERR